MKVVLALAPVWDSLTPPLTLAFLKASLQEAGYECRCMDFSIQFRPMVVSALGDIPAEQYIASHPELSKKWAKQICDEKPDVVGFSLLGSNVKNTALIAKEVRNLLPEAVIISGGPSMVRENKDNLEQAHSFSDFVIEGEAEKALVDAIRCIERGDDMARLKQVWLKGEDGSLYYTGHGEEQNIDSIPWPDFSDFDRKSYTFPNRLPLLFSRGCILNCNYCENKWNHLTQRSRTGRLVFEELKRDVREYNITEYMFNDDSLISFKTFKQLEEFCDLAIAEGLVMPWSVYGTRVERKLTDSYVSKLRKSGMERVSLGVETFSSKVQHDMGKSSRYDDADKTCRMFANQGIKTESWIIYGYPTEGDAEFEETLQWFISNPEVLSHVTVNVFGPNAKYLHDKPNVIRYYSENQWDWVGLESTIAKRKERFLLLMDVLESIRQSRKGKFTYVAGDPYYVKHFSSWGRKEKSALLDAWAELEGYPRKKTSLEKVREFLSWEKPKALIVESGFMEAYDLDAVIASANTDDLRERLYKRVEEYLDGRADMTEEAQLNELKFFKDKMKEICRLSAGRIAENVLYFLALQGPVDKMVDDMRLSNPKQIAQQLVEQVKTVKEKRELSNALEL